jgi:hypothetical protein
MQLVMKRSRLSGLWSRFRITARLDLDTQEQHLLVRYALRGMTLTEGRLHRDLIRAALITIPIVLILAFLLAIIMAVLGTISINSAAGILLFMLFVTFIVVYLQIRETVSVSDLLIGRDFKARSLISLLNTESRIRKMAEIFQRILEQAKTWHTPEVIDLTPKPLLSALEDENAVAG